MLKTILKWLKGEPRAQFKRIGRNDDCPCGSGEKFKRCCMDHVEKKTRADRDSSLYGSSKG